MELIHLRDKIYYIKGNGGNIGVLSNKNGFLLVDDQFESIHQNIISTLKKIHNAPVKYIINTHWHVDHTNGNEAFGKKGSKIIAHQNSYQRMTTDQYISVFNHHQKPYSETGLPQITFKENMTIKFANQNIQMFHAKHAHTDGDLIVFFKESNIIHTGDVFVTYGYPFIDQPNGGSIYGVLNILNKIIELSNKDTLIIPGHGNVSNINDVKKYKNMLLTILDRIETLYAKNISLKEILKTHPCKGFSSSKINEATFTNIIYNNLKSKNDE